MKNTRKILYILILIISFLLIGTVKSKAGSLYLNDLNFDVQINSNGSMNVTETWDINISSTNTLYKTFKTDSKKYSNITDVTVTDITNESSVNFVKTNDWAYHVTKGYYYGTENNDGNFEIGWGVGLDNSSANKKYKISYTVNDVITKYNDYSELYWQFVGEDFEISSKKITGTIYLPSNASNKDDIKVWGHTKDLNGTIYATDTNKIEFNLDNFRSGRYVEIRTLFPTNLISSTGRTKNTDILDSAVNEETKWANKANNERRRLKIAGKIILILVILACVIINIFVSVIYIKNIKKNKKKLKELKKYKPTIELEYFRDLPSEESTPGEAIRTVNINLSSFEEINFGNIFSATILDLALKGFLEIKQEKNKKNIEIYIKKQSNNELKQDEMKIMNFLREVAKDNEGLTLIDLEKFIKKHPTKILHLIEASYKSVNNQLINEEIIDEDIQKEYEEYTSKKVGYIGIGIGLLFSTLFIFIVPTILLIINGILCGKIAKKLNVLTQKGVDQQAEWKGLKKYMEDFSLLKEREVPELVIWERFLVYATVFGIAEKVIKQLKIVYPNFEEMSSEITTYRYMDLMIRTDFSSSFSHAISSSISSSISSTYSSGSGSGGGFSGGGGFGGGGGRRRWKINSLIYIVFVKFLIVLINSHFTDGGCKTSSA